MLMIVLLPIAQHSFWQVSQWIQLVLFIDVTYRPTIKIFSDGSELIMLSEDSIN